MNRTNRLIYYLLLLIFPVAFLLHNVNENFGLISFTDLATLLSQYLLITLVITVFSLMVIKEPAKSTVFSFALLIIYFGYGAFKDVGKQHRLPAMLMGYKVLLPSLFVAVCLLAFYLKTTRYSLQRPVNMIALFLLVNLAVETGWCGYNAVTRADVKQDFGDHYHVQIKDYHPAAAVQKPDVFWLVFDEYAASGTLKKVWDFSNPLDSMLRRKGFRVAGAVKSNYNFTHYSMASTLDMVYLKGLANHTVVTLKDLVRGAFSISDNNVVRVFEKNGYIIRNFSIFNMKGHPSKGLKMFAEIPASLINYQTLAGRLYKDIGWNFTHIFSADKQKADSLSLCGDMIRLDHSYHAMLKRSLKDMHEGLASPAPSFFMLHFMLPHEPYMYNADGSIAFKNGLSEVPKDYLPNLQYTNTVIQQLADSIQAMYRHRNMVIIIQGDHGFKFQESDPLYDTESCHTLYAVYCSDNNYTGWNDPMSTVNSFRILFNKYFYAGLKILPDTSYNLYYR